MKRTLAEEWQIVREPWDLAVEKTTRIFTLAADWVTVIIVNPVVAYLEWRRFNRIVSRLTWAKRGQAINRAYVRQLARELEREWTG